MARSLSSDRFIIDERAVGFGAAPAVHYSTLLIQTLTTGELGWDFPDRASSPIASARRAVDLSRSIVGARVSELTFVASCRKQTKLSRFGNHS